MTFSAGTLITINSMAETLPLLLPHCAQRAAARCVFTLTLWLPTVAAAVFVLATCACGGDFALFVALLPRSLLQSASLLATVAG